jgi:hypothetical protein
MPCLTIILVLIMCTIRHYNWTRYLWHWLTMEKGITGILKSM